MVKYNVLLYEGAYYENKVHFFLNDDSNNNNLKIDTVKISNSTRCQQEAILCIQQSIEVNATKKSRNQFHPITNAKKKILKIINK